MDIKYRLGVTSKHGVINPGDIVVIPANFSHSVRWIGKLERIGIALDTSLFADAIDDDTNLNRNSLVSQIPTCDPLICQLGRVRPLLDLTIE